MNEAFRVPFCFSYQQILPNHLHADRPTKYRLTSLSSPPVVAGAFHTQARSTIFAWSPGSLRPITRQEAGYLVHYKTSSIYWCPDHQSYLAVDYDCTTHNVRDRARRSPMDNWERLKFGHESIGDRPVSILGHCFPNDRLAATGPETWMGELIPDAHQYQGAALPAGLQGPSLLAGDLSLILGLAALSSPWEPTTTIQYSFRPDGRSPSWLPHGQSDRQRGEHGIVMHIFYDYRNGSREQLEAWENGNSGAILE